MGKAVSSFIESSEDGPAFLYQATLVGRQSRVTRTGIERHAKPAHILIPKEQQLALMFDEVTGNNVIVPRRSSLFGSKFAPKPPMHDFPIVSIEDESVREIKNGGNTSPDLHHATKKRTRVTHYTKIVDSSLSRR